MDQGLSVAGIARERTPTLAGLAGQAADVVDRYRPLMAVLAVLLVLGAVSRVTTHVQVTGDLVPRAGIDFRQYVDATQSWLAGSGFYHAWQLAGAYTIPDHPVTVIPILPVLYPPPAVLLFLPWAMAPAAWPLWWGVPLAFLGWFVIRVRPRPWTWPLLALCTASDNTIWLTISGNPVMWLTAAVAAGLLWNWPAVAVLLKPTLAPFALIGAHRRTWWITLVLGAVVAVVFGAMWFDYLTVLRNVRGSGIDYSVSNVWMMGLPVIAWLGRRRVPGSLRVAGAWRTMDR